MQVLLVSFTRKSGLSNVQTIKLFSKLKITRTISNNASAARKTIHKHVPAAADKIVQPKPATQLNKAAQVSKRAPGSFRPELQRYLNQETPTVLVQSQSPTAYKICLYALGGFCIAYGIINHYMVLHDPPTELPSFVKGTHYSINIAMICGGIFCLYKTTRIISRISAIPYMVNKSTGQRGLMLQIESYRTLPSLGRGPKMMQIPAADVFTNSELGVPGMHNSTPVPPTQDDKIAERMYLRQQRRREHQENMSRLYTLPFREGGKFLGRAFVGFRDTLYGDGWIHLRAKSRNGTWRIGKDFEWALDAGHAFDKVIKVEKL